MTRAQKFIAGGTALIVLLGIVLVLRSSQTPRTQLDASFVAERWASALRQYNITPVFPPHYMQVGDVYLFLTRPDGKDDTNAFRRYGLWLGRADVRHELQEEARNELALPSTSAQNPGGDIFGTPVAVRGLRPTAYPGFNIAQVSESDLQSGFFSKLFQGTFGGSGRGEVVMSMSIPLAEDQELSAPDAEHAYEEFCKTKNGHSPCRYDDSLFKICMGTLRQEGDPDNMVPTLVFVSHVFYARQISYFFSTKSGAAFALGAGLVAGEQKEGSSSSAPSIKTPAPPASDENKGHNNPAAETAKDLKTAAFSGSSPDQQHPVSASISAVQSKDGGITLNQTFDTPVAIGFRGLEFQPVGYVAPKRQVDE